MKRWIRNLFPSHPMRRAGQLAAVVVGLTSARVHAQTSTWTAGNGINWNSSLNWSGGIPTASSNVVFNAGAPFSPLLTGNGFAASLTFNSGSTNYTLTSNAGVSLSGVTAITVAAGTTGVTTINLANIATGSLLFPSGQNLTFTNNAAATAVTAPTLVIGPNTVIGTPGNGGVVFGGTGTTVFSGSFADSSGSNNAVQGGLFKTGPGTLVLAGNGSNLIIGGMNLNGGTLRLDYAANTASKFGGVLTSSGGDLVIVPNASNFVTQAASGTTLAGGHTQVNFAGGGLFATLNLAAITRSVGATIDFSGSPQPFSVATSTGNTNGLVGGGPAFATLDGTRWATASGGFLQSLTGTANTITSGTNTELTSSVTFNGGAPRTNSLRFAANNTQVQINTFMALTVQSGGILVPTGVVGSSITTADFGILTADNLGEILIHAYGPLTVTTDIHTNVGLTKTGPDVLTLGHGGVTPGLLGPITVRRGGLTVTNVNAVTNVSAINFTDNVTRGNGAQTFTVDTGNGSTPTINQPIRFSTAADGPNIFPNVISTGASTNSRVTLSGVISSAPGITTPIRFDGEIADSSGFNLTGANTFTGTVCLQNGTLGISSNASLGDPVNRLELANGSFNSGGLLFLNGGIDLTRPVAFRTDSWIYSNGTDVNTISGPLSQLVGSSLRFYKSGTGTLVLTPAANALNLFFLRVEQGTLRVNAAGLGAPAYVVVRSGATLSLMQDATITADRFFLLGQDIDIGYGTVDVAGGTTFTIDGQIQTSSNAIMGLVKTGPGTLALNNATNSYALGTTVRAGVLRAGSDGALSSGPVVVEPAGRLTYANSTTTARTFNLTGGTLESGTGATVTLNGATVLGGFMRSTGTGQFAVGSAGATLIGTTIFSGTTINQTGGPLTAENLTFGGTHNIGTLQSFIGINLNYTASSTLNIGPGATANMTNFTGMGNLILSPNAIAGANISSTGTLTLGGGSTTFIGTQGNRRGNINLNGGTLQLRGGLLVNAGPTTNVGGVTNGTTVVNFGGLAKGNGYYDNIISVNGGVVSGGFSPGVLNAGTFNVNGGGGTFAFEITDPGASTTFPAAPGAPGNNPGWDTVAATTRIRFTATPSDKYTIVLTTQLPLPSVDQSGPMANFDPTKSYSWLFASNPTGAVVDVAGNPVTFDQNAITLATAGTFINPTNGTFSISITANNQQVFITYTPVPEPGLMLVIGGAMLGVVGYRRKRAV